VNTRLQVEHPITEEITGVDLVQLQLEIASGKPLQLQQKDIRSQGHSFECRLYAEDASKNFQPSPGTVADFYIPEGPGIRMDAGVYPGAEVPVYYDPILAKLVVHGQDRESARKRMIYALQNLAITGIRTSVSYLMDVMNHPSFCEGKLTTHFLKDHFSDWTEQRNEESLELALMAYVLDEALPKSNALVHSSETGKSEYPSPWQSLGRWRI